GMTRQGCQLFDQCDVGLGINRNMVLRLVEDGAIAPLARHVEDSSEVGFHRASHAVRQSQPLTHQRLRPSFREILEIKVLQDGPPGKVAFEQGIRGEAEEGGYREMASHGQTPVLAVPPCNRRTY